MNKSAFEKNKFFAPINLESKFNRFQRTLIATCASVAIIFFLFIIFYIVIQARLTFFPILPKLPFTITGLTGTILILLAVRLTIFAVDRFISSTTFNKNGILSSDDFAQRLNYFAAQLLFYSVYNKSNPTLTQLLTSLPQTPIGTNILIRLGISPDEFGDFLADYKRETPELLNQPFGQIASIPQDRDITASDLLAILFNQDPNFHDFLIAKFVDEQTLRDTAQWIEQSMTRDDRELRWWSREKLGRIPGLAKTWAFGPVFTLMQFAVRVGDQATLASPVTLMGRENEIKILEDTLLAQANANVIVVGEPGAGKETLIHGLTQMILQGKVFPELESKRLFSISGPAIVATGKTKGNTEEILVKILNEASYAGDIILIIEQFPEFVESLDGLGIIAAQILEPYLAGNTLHIIAMANTTPFRKIIENNAAIMAHFEKIEVHEPDENHLLSILRDVAPRIEAQARGSIVFTYPALKKIAEAGVRYLTEGALPERAINFMQELVTYALSRHIILVSPELVAEYVGKKTEIPLGKITKEEQDKLMNLEDRLHERVINQSEAISAIATTIRRARAGIGEPKRPIGSFLFLGPTGVGKTETAKALAWAYFGNEDAMMRFDMTEYQTENAIERLIGSFEKNEPGILASRIHSSPYGALLLDEFEKADKKVMDLFLQILDEGFFSDAFDQKINMRNTIIIATSNAGAQMIWRMVEGNIDPSTKKSVIIAEIQQEGKFKPELLNRFDAIIIYQPLSQEHLRQVARIMLKKLTDRLKEQQDITFVITDELIDETVRQGYEPTFGARPMRRFIQDKIEKIIAE
ncbi:MAG: ATP-dependent Clp protease ATP-binding subunit, partial [Patescibacteria group bacterium]